MTFEDRSYTRDELVTALVNLEWIIRNREGGYAPDMGMIGWGHGGSDETDLLRKDFTPASQEAGLR